MSGPAHAGGGRVPEAPVPLPSADRWRTLEPLLDAALALPPEQRAAFVDAACGTDADLRAELARMLDDCAHDTGWLDRPVAERFAALVVDDDLVSLRAALEGRYALERRIGRGGMGTVFLTRDVRHDRAVALKVLSSDLGTGRAAARFLSEIRLTARLRHPRLLPLYDSGEAAGRLYYVTPYVAGGTLRDRLARGAPLPIDEATRILREVAEALAYAHAHGVVHRDVKPENVLLDDVGAVLADFGIATAVARATDAGGDGAMRTRTTLGTPAYMAPEQAAGDPACDGCADLYAWGCMAYELLTGAVPFAGRTPRELVAAHFTERPAPIGTRRPDVPPVLAALVMQCLEKSPAARPATAQALAAALADPSLGATAGAGATGRSWRPSMRPSTPSTRSTHPPGRRWRRVGGVVGLVLVALAIGGWSLVPVEARATLRTLVTRPPARFRVNRVVVAAFRDETRDPALAALGSLVADYLTEGLSRLGSLQVVDARTAATTGAVVRRIPRLLRAGDDQALGEETGAQVVVAGSYYLDGDSVRFRARVLDAATGEVRQAFPPVAAPVRAPASAVAALSAGIVATLRAASDPDGVVLGEHSPPPSLAAFAAVQEAWQAFVRQRPDSAVVQPLLRAAALDSTYGTPLPVLAYLATALGQYAVSDSAIRRAAPLRDRLTAFEQSLLDVADAIARGDMPAALTAAQHGPPNEHLIAFHALLARRPAEVVRVFAPMDPDRGINIPWASYYWGRLAVAHAQLGHHDRALAAVRAGERRAPPLAAQGLDVAVHAARGDTAAVRAALAARWRSGERPASVVARATTLLRTRGGHEAVGARWAREWADRIYPTGTPVDTTGLSLPVPPAVELLVAAERWADVPPVIEAAEARFAQDSAAAARSPGWLTEKRQRLQLLRAIAFAHLGRRAEAMAIDAGFARTMGARWDRGVSAMARGAIAAHLGAPRAAVPLLAEAVEQGALDVYLRRGATGLGSLDGDPLLLPLRADPAFRALSRPVAEDR